MHLIKMKDFGASKHIIKNVERQPMGWKKISGNYRF